MAVFDLVLTENAILGHFKQRKVVHSTIYKQRRYSTVEMSYKKMGH